MKIKQFLFNHADKIAFLGLIAISFVFFFFITPGIPDEYIFNGVMILIAIAKKIIDQKKKN